MDDRTGRVRGAVLGVVVPLGLAVALLPFRGHVDNANVALALVVAVVATAVVGGRLVGALAAVTATLAFDVFHTEPYLRPTIDAGADIVTTVLLLVVGLVVGTLAARGRRASAAATDARDELRRVHRLAELTASGEDGATVLGSAQGELVELLSLDGCRFEAPPYDTDFPVLERSGVLGPSSFRSDESGYELPRSGVSLPVLARGRPVGRFVLTPRPGVGLTLERRIVAVALADQVGGALVSQHG